MGAAQAARAGGTRGAAACLPVLLVAISPHPSAPHTLSPTTPVVQVRVREAIRARGLLLHDAFTKFDADANGLLSLAEVYGALDWLQIPDILPADILFFVRSITSKPHITYADFVEVLCPPEELEAINLAGGEEVAAAAAAGGSGAGSSGLPTAERQKSKVQPKGERELQQLLDSTVAAEQRAESALEESEAKLVAEAQAKLEAALVDSDFGCAPPPCCPVPSVVVRVGD